ncbi:hypothetical protein ACOI1C_17905 [Bacillus sp. DJP31]|uniref:hypothetical protein n=1 Tax=Bacillus sp. DJP31 TaxID=3409789 RepID=UPI003BB55EA3
MAGAVTGPLYDTWINPNIESRVRATVLSLSSQMNALGQTIGGPVVGAAASRYSLLITNGSIVSGIHSASHSSDIFTCNEEKEGQC